jgi:4-amino-4-deoxy-L-arabinose transferase-like glycosyltransferase
MNKLAVLLFVTKYYDVIFLIFVSIFTYAFYSLSKRGDRSFIGTIFIKLFKKLETDNYKKLIILTLLVLGLLVRLYKIGSPVADWHSFRQADTSSVSRMYVEKGIDLLRPRYHDVSTTQSGLFNPQGYRFVEFPVYNLFQASFYRMFPILSLEVWGRLISIFSALVSSYLIYLLGKKYISFWGGIISMIFFLFIPYNIYFTRVILPEPLSITFALIGLWNFISFIESENKSYLMFSSVSFSLGLLIKPYVVFFGLPVLYLTIEKYGLRGFFKKKELIITGLVIFLPFILWRVWMRQFPEGIPFWKWTLNGDNIRFKPAFWYWIFGERITKLILGYMGLIPFALGLISRNTKKFLYYFLLGVLIYLAVFATANVRHDYYQTQAIPVISLFLALGVIKMWDSKNFNRSISRGLLVFSMFVMLVVGFFQTKEFYKINHPEIIAAGAAVDRLTPKDALVIAAYNGDTAFLYQTKRRGWPVVDRPIDELIEKGANYYASVNLDHPQTKEFMMRFKIVKQTNDYVVLNLNEESS